MKPTIPLTLASVAIATIGIVGLHATKPAGSPQACACAPAPVVEPVVIERHFAEPPPAPEPVLVEPVQRPYPVSQD